MKALPSPPTNTPAYRRRGCSRRRPTDRDERRDRETLHQDRKRVLDAHHAGVEKREAGERHQEHERGRNDHPGGVAAVDRGMASGTLDLLQKFADRPQSAHPAPPVTATFCRQCSIRATGRNDANQGFDELAASGAPCTIAAPSRCGVVRECAPPWCKRSAALAFDPKSLEELARKLADAVPPGLAAFRDDLERNFRPYCKAASRSSISSRARNSISRRQSCGEAASVSKSSNGASPRSSNAPTKNSPRGPRPVTLATVLTRAQFALEAPLVRVEVHCGAGLPQFTVVGLAETAVRESRERVRAALAQGGFEFPGRPRDGQPRAGRPAEGGRALRPRGGARHPGRIGTAARGVPRRHRVLRRALAFRRTARSARRAVRRRCTPCATGAGSSCRLANAG